MDHHRLRCCCCGHCRSLRAVCLPTQPCPQQVEPPQRSHVALARHTPAPEERLRCEQVQTDAGSSHRCGAVMRPQGLQRQALPGGQWCFAMRLALHRMQPPQSATRNRHRSGELPAR
jgi:hypothetical protein